MRDLRRPMPAFVTLAAFLLVLLPSPAAQQALEPSPTANRLYAHYDATNTTTYLSAAILDGNGTSNPGTSLPALPGTNTTFTWSLPLRPALSSPLRLDPAGNITVNVFMGASQGAGAVNVTTRLEAGSQVIAVGAGLDHRFLPADTGAYTRLTWNLTPNATLIPVGTTLVWNVTASGVAPNGIFLGTSAGRGRSNLTLPILPPLAPVVTTTSTTTTTTESSTSTISTTTTTTSPPTTTSSSSTTTTSPSSITSEAPSEIQAQDSPSTGLLLLAAGLLATALVARRRLP